MKSARCSPRMVLAKWVVRRLMESSSRPKGHSIFF